MTPVSIFNFGPLDTATIVALFTFCGMAVTAIWAFLGKREATQANRAVNHQAKGSPTLYELVRETRDDVRGTRDKVDALEQFRDGYAGSSLPDGAAVERLVGKVDAIAIDVAYLKADVKKYGCPVKTGGLETAHKDCIQPVK